MHLRSRPGPNEAHPFTWKDDESSAECKYNRELWITGKATALNLCSTWQAHMNMQLHQVQGTLVLFYWVGGDVTFNREETEHSPVMWNSWLRTHATAFFAAIISCVYTYRMDKIVQHYILDYVDDFEENIEEDIYFSLFLFLFLFLIRVFPGSTDWQSQGSLTQRVRWKKQTLIFYKN